MHKLVELVRENQKFQERLADKRDIPKEEPFKDAENDLDVPPMFNKRLFASQGGTVILTAEARRIMEKNKESEFCKEDRKLTKSELLTMRFVTEGLRLIHKGHDYVKDVLSHAVTYENLDAFSYVKTKPWEEILSCYYIVNGAVEVTYDMNATTGSRSVYQPNIIYNHGTGEYLGLVSFEGPSEDLTPPATIYTKEYTQFLRIDRQRFHRLLQVASSLIDSRKRNYLSRGRGLLASVAADVKEKILQSLSIQDFPPNRILINLGETTENIYIIMNGRCHCYRDVYIPEADRTVTFYLCSKEQDQFFGEECVLSNEPSYCTVVSATAITCLKLNRSALQIVSKDRLAKLIENQRNQYPEDEELRTRGYTNSIWNQYKHSKIKQSLKEGGKLNYMHHLEHHVVRERPPEDEDQYREDMFEFLLKSYDTSSRSRRSQSARPGSTKRSMVPDRPKTAIPTQSREQRKIQLGRQLSQLKPDTTITEEDSRDSTEIPLPSNAVSAKRLEAHPEKLMNSKENVLKVAEDNNDMMKHLKMSTSVGEYKQQENENFTKSSVLATMRTEDIVRRAKALANRKAETGFEATDKEEPEWSTVLHVENKQAKILIKTNNFRINILKKNLKALDKKREMMRAKRFQTKSDSPTPIQESFPDVQVTDSPCLLAPDEKVPVELDRNEYQTEVDKTGHPKDENSILFSVNTYLTETTSKW
ncbi:hypothetical protein CHS0354_015465 [Potamilus streckersoni]|uniref:Cyclic nucleotide-binding domain-containing protein n=1 Tax=Potamilus streckersoni TaxID=2493646 RepID=A0AAE0RRD7_9BIVA|nr:hypothetical protein CHS0354_015465 [Potamilus streckersoni]